MKKIFVLCILSSLCGVLGFQRAIAKSHTLYSVGLSSMYNKINDPSYRFIREYEGLTSPINAIKGYSVGITRIEGRLSYNYTTNRLSANYVARDIKHRVTGGRFVNNTKNITDTFGVGYFKDKMLYSIGITWVNSYKRLETMSGDLLGKEKIQALVPNVTVGRFVHKNIFPSITLIAPSDKLDMEYGFAFNLSLMVS